MRDGRVVLSRRLGMLADMVTRESRVVDVGCDHGFLSIYLVQQGISPRVLAMDVRKGPLAAAAQHIAECGLGEYIETRLSDGLHEYRLGEADTLVCAGMGGRLMARIVSESMEKAEALGELILQPQSELREFREFLRTNGFRVVAEDAVYEEGKYYFSMRAVPDRKVAATGQYTTEEQRLFDEYGELLLREKHPVLQQYLLFRKKVMSELAERLAQEETGRTEKRLAEIKAELSGIGNALQWFRD